MPKDPRTSWSLAGGVAHLARGEQVKINRNHHARSFDPSRDGDKALTWGRLMRDCHGEWLYFLRVGATVKIGHTVNLANRIPQYGGDAVSRILHIEPGTREDEAALHQRFRPFRAARLEYYGPAPHLLRYINERRAECYGMEPIDWSAVEQRKAG